MTIDRRLPLCLAALAALVLAACGSDPQPVDPCARITCPPTTFCQGGACIPDGTQQLPPVDGGKDAGQDGGADGGEEPDAGEEPDGGGADAGEDGGTGDAGADAGQDAGQEDAGTQDAGTDAGTDAGVDAGTGNASQQIAQARATPDGAGLSLPISGAIVTYLKPAVGTEGAGFTVQAEPSGPALFVNVDPATLTPSPAVGDAVQFTITAMDTLGGLTVRMAAELAPGSWVRLSSGTPVSPLVQNLSAATDLVSALDTYETEVVQIAATLIGGFGGAGTGHLKASIETAGYPFGNGLLKLRVPAALRDALDLVQGCSVMVQATPLWRLGTEVQVAAWTAQDLATVSGCPAPALLGAASVSSTQVLLTFDRHIAPGSATGSSFTFTGGLLSLGASASGKTVTVSTTPQSAGSAYTVTVAGSVTDLQGTGVDASANQASFTSNPTPAVVILNEVNPNITSGRDLLELRVKTAGNTQGITVQQSSNTGPQVVAALPAANVAAGDLIVVHFTPTATELDEILSKTQYPQASHPTHYDTAWDVRGTTSPLTFSNRVLTVVSEAGVVTDAVAFTLSNIASPPASFPDWVQEAQAAGHWLPASCGGGPCTYVSSPTVVAISVDYLGVASNPSSSVQRAAGGVDSQSKGDWSAAGPSSFGLPNP